MQGTDTWSVWDEVGQTALVRLLMRRLINTSQQANHSSSDHRRKYSIYFWAGLCGRTFCNPILDWTQKIPTLSQTKVLENKNPWLGACLSLIQALWVNHCAYTYLSIVRTPRVFRLLAHRWECPIRMKLLSHKDIKSEDICKVCKLM